MSALAKLRSAAVLGVALTWVGTGPAWAAPTFAVTATISGVPGPISTAEDPQLGLVMTAGIFGIAVIDEGTNSVVASMDLPRQQFGIAIDTHTHTAYIATLGRNDGSGGNITVYDEASRSVTHTIALDGGMVAVAVDHGLGRVYAAENRANKLAVLSERKNTVVATIPVGRQPIAVAVDPRTHIAYVANAGDDTVSVVDETTNTVVDTVAVGVVPLGIAVDPATNTVVVANEGGGGAKHGSVSVIDGATNTVTGKFAVPLATGITVDPKTHTIYVTTFANSGVVTVARESDNAVLATLAVKENPGSVAVDTRTHTAYVGNEYGVGGVSVISRMTGAHP